MGKLWDTVSCSPISDEHFSSLQSLEFSVMGKAEGHGTNWHGHVTALSVAPDYRRLGLAAKLMSGLEEISEK